jgi:hypothetical protein
VDAVTQSQVFFPGEVDVELSIIPDDELPALIEESFDLPPIDLTLPVEDRDSLSVVILAPMPRHALRSQLKSLGELTKNLHPLSMLGQGPQKPLDRLGAMKISLAEAASISKAKESPVTREWAEVVNSLTNFGLDGDASTRTLWYMRRRTLRRSADLESVLVAVNNLDIGDDSEVLNPEEPVVDEPKPAVDTLPDNAKKAIIALSGTGELQKIADTQFRKISDAMVEVYANAINNTPIVKEPITITALTARISNGRPNASSAAKKTVENLLSANREGMSLLSATLIGRGTTKVSVERFKILFDFLVVDGFVEKFAGDIVQLEKETVREVLKTLTEIIENGNPDELKEIAQKVSQMAQESRRPTPRPEPVVPDNNLGAEEEARRRAEKERLRRLEDERRRKIEAERRRTIELATKKREATLVKSLGVKADQTRLMNVLKKAKPADRTVIVNLMTSAKIAQSKVATQVALNGLATGGEIGPLHIKRLRAVNSSFVTGLAVFEATVLSSKTVPIPRTARLSASKMKTLVASTISRRTALLTGAKNIKTLSAFGVKNKANKPSIAKVSGQLIKVLDTKTTTTRTVVSAITKLTSRS